ncbi:MarR family transcriptional regulator [Haematobacter massiliensis]|uniref:MarR family transcriptional regulator n=2 Tax=Haematobacter massiliensis TaxID=195105 RepID=A0A086YAP4_9RHOB|nr:MarR family winged helix-turn-helix transcriptional regulator [Haematobacter massiliensis]KFI31344.1 MarR family transcriptional regulator [Haematobacter massiliensis]OWJ73665.1 MarR family transcriptional regulator [Haematobacter massiliensis]OWJ81876.1 MarR family transcriptional regulator [Haematobacter massiliensis]QBJ23427.1 MarR family transcriptional regulator [Haematobacter massiliensis]
MNTKHPTTGSLVWHLAMRWRNEVDHSIAPLGLTHAQYSALASLHSLVERGLSPSQKELADYTGLQPIYVSKLVRTLEAAGYLKRESHQNDSRAVSLTLTETGFSIVTEARRIVKALDARLTEPLGGPDGERTRLLAGALQDLLGQPKPK